MGTQTQTPMTAPAAEEQHISMLDEVISETERQAKDRIIVRRAELDLKQRYARAFAASGCFADIKGQGEGEAIAKALVKIELGEAMGFTPAESMTGIDIIQGRVAVGANLRAARMQRAGFSWRFSRMDNKGCVLHPYFKGQQLLDERGQAAAVGYTEEDASRAGLAGKDNYKKNASDMYFARAITRMQRRYAPGVLGIDILSSEEAIDMPMGTPSGVDDAPVGGIRMPERKAPAPTAEAAE